MAAPAPRARAAARDPRVCRGQRDDGDNGGGVFLPPSGWVDETGGQTGSLTPTCGLPPHARAQGVSSATGIVLYTSQCPDLPSGLGLFDASGNAVPFQTQPIGSGVVLVTPAAGLAPGSYTLGTAMPVPTQDQDAGLDQDGGADPDETAGDAGVASVEGEAITILEPSVAPTRLGELQQPRGTCSNLLELTLDPAVLPYLSALALDVRVSPGAGAQRLASFGTLLVSPSGVVSIEVPLELIETHRSVRVSVEAVLASGALAIAPATFDLTCLQQASPSASPSNQDEDSGACGVRRTVARPAPAGAPWLVMLLALGLWVRRRRRRRRRPPD
jgi:hypothetical protein